MEGIIPVKLKFDFKNAGINANIPVKLKKMLNFE
jgi:hypothetical protein